MVLLNGVVGKVVGIVGKSEGAKQLKVGLR